MRVSHDVKRSGAGFLNATALVSAHFLEHSQVRLCRHIADLVAPTCTTISDRLPASTHFTECTCLRCRLRVIVNCCRVQAQQPRYKDLRNRTESIQERVDKLIAFPEPLIPNSTDCEDGAEKKAILVEATTRSHASQVRGLGLAPAGLSYCSSCVNCACNVCAAAAAL